MNHPAWVIGKITEFTMFSGAAFFASCKKVFIDSSMEWGYMAIIQLLFSLIILRTWPENSARFHQPLSTSASKSVPVRYCRAGCGGPDHT